MKKFGIIIAAVAILFSAMSCSTSAMHDADVMLVEKVVVEGLTDLAGKEMVISGNWILGKDGKSNWLNGMGDLTDIAEGAVGTVDIEGTVTFEINAVTSVPELVFLGKVNEDGWSDAKRFGEKAYAEGDAKIANLFTGSAKAKTLLGRVGGDKTITWELVDAIIPVPKATFVNITAIKFVNVPAARNGQKIGVVEGWIPGNDWASYQPGMTGIVTGGEVTFTFPTAVKVESDSIGIQSTVVKDTNSVDWDNKVLSDTVSVAISFDDANHVIEVNFASITGSLK